MHVRKNRVADNIHYWFGVGGNLVHKQKERVESLREIYGNYWFKTNEKNNLNDLFP